MERKGIRIAFWFCTGLAAAVTASVLLLGYKALLHCLAAALLPGLLCRLSKGREARLLSLVFLGAAFGFALSQACLCFTLLPAENLAKETREVECRVVELPRYYESSESVVVRLCGDELPSLRCRVTVYDRVELEPGDELRCTLYFSSARLRYGVESDDLTAKGIFLRGTVQGEIEKIGRWKYARLYAPLLWKEKILQRCAQFFPADTVAFQKALLTGDKTELYDDYELYTALSRAGLTHVVAVSGMHVSFLVGFLSMLLPNRRLLALLALPFLLLFAALTGFTPSVCRAVFMQFVLLLAPFVRREADSLTSLALALALLLCVNPCCIAGVSLQLSFSCTAGILLCAEPLRERLTAFLPKRGILSRTLRAMLSAVAVSLAALAFTLPLMALHFGSVSLVSPLSNALCLWLVSLLFLGGFGVLGLGLLSPQLGSMAGNALAYGDRAIFFVAKKLSALPFAALYTENPVNLWWLLASYAIFAFFLLKGRREKKSPSLWRPLLISLLCLSLALGSVQYERSKPGLAVSVIDVGQGACTLLEQGNTALMVDCGATFTLDDAGDTAAVYALSRGRTELSALILTHLHRDHANGAEKVMSLLKVKRLYLLPGLDEEMEQTVLATADRRGTEVIFVDRELLLREGELELRLCPPSEKEDDPNLFIWARYGEFDTLITGDADCYAERYFVKTTLCENIELLLVGHHGSKYSTDPAVLDSLRPSTAVISVGNNTYGHPTQDVLERLESRSIEVFRTDRDGTVRLRGDKDGSIQQEKPRQKRS